MLPLRSNRIPAPIRIVSGTMIRIDSINRMFKEECKDRNLAEVECVMHHGGILIRVPNRLAVIAQIYKITLRRMIERALQGAPGAPLGKRVQSKIVSFRMVNVVMI